MHSILSLYAFLLFVLLTPRVLLRIPSNGSTLTNAVVHGLAFILIWHLTSPYVFYLSGGTVEGFDDFHAKARKLFWFL